MADWDRAVRDAAEDPPAGARSAVAHELVALWSDLEEGRRSAINGRWSMQCDWFTIRIVHLSRLVGATPWDQIPLTLLSDGTYEGILRAAAIDYQPPDMAKVERIERENRAST